MKQYCIGCKKKHDDLNWKTVWDQNVLITMCSKYFRPSNKEWVPQRIKDDRKQFKKDILQPWRAGEASKEFIDAYPERSKKLFTEKERKNARDVWKDI